MADTICDTKLACGRVEIRTGVGRRRRWAAEEKGRIVAEALVGGVPVAEIARRHDMSSQHLFNWIRAAKEGRLALPADACAGGDDVVFVPVVAAIPEMAKAPKIASSPAVCIEIAIKECVVRAVSGTDVRLLVDVLRAVKAA
jgi:transposase